MMIGDRLRIVREAEAIFDLLAEKDILTGREGKARIKKLKIEIPPSCAVDAVNPVAICFQHC